MIPYYCYYRYLPAYTVRAAYWIIIDAAGNRDLLTATTAAVDPICTEVYSEQCLIWEPLLLGPRVSGRRSCYIRRTRTSVARCDSHRDLIRRFSSWEISSPSSTPQGSRWTRALKYSVWDLFWFISISKTNRTVQKRFLSKYARI